MNLLRYITQSAEPSVEKEAVDMKKIKLFAVFTVVITMLISVSASAAEYCGVPDIINITDGIDMEKEFESTFDDTRTITGKAQKGASVVISVCSENNDGTLDIKDSYQIEIGASGYFSKKVKLYDGENIIIISADNDTASVTAHIRRKSMEIKNMLERGVYTPGVRMKSYSIFSV